MGVRRAGRTGSAARDFSAPRRRGRVLRRVVARGSGRDGGHAVRGVSGDLYRSPQRARHRLRIRARRRHDGVAARRRRPALAAVGATPRWLDLCQHSHVERADPIVEPPGAVDALVETIADLQPTCVVAPLGLSHPDHQACHASALAARERAGPVRWLWYSDLPYVFIPRVLAARFRALHRVGITATPACPSVSADFAAKWRAFGEYATQLPVLDRLWRLRERLERAGEQYWTLDR